MPLTLANSLKSNAVERIKTPGAFGDGQGLYLVIGKPPKDKALQAKPWIFRYVSNGRVREMGLGSAHEVTLAEARAGSASRPIGR